MAHYVILVNFTEQGIRNVKDTVQRAEAFKQLAKKHGVNVVALYWTLGQYDLVTICESGDDMAMTALGLTMGKLGNVRTQTLRAFDAGEMAKILAKVE